MYEALLIAHPNDTEILTFTGIAYFQLNDFNKASQHFIRALGILPNDPALNNNLALALFELGLYEQACEHLETAIRLAPGYTDAYFNLGRTLGRIGKTQEALNILRMAIDLDPEHGKAYHLLAILCSDYPHLAFLTNYYLRLALHALKQTPSKESLGVRHTFFVDPKKALETALQGNRRQETVAVSSPQICYCFGDAFPDAPANLIQLSQEYGAFEEFFLSSRLGLPIDVEFDPSVPEERLLAKKIAFYLNEAINVARPKIQNKLLEKFIQSKPIFVSGQSLRVFMWGSRLTTVMQYNFRDLAQAFRELGCEVLFLIEADDREYLTRYNMFRETEDFNPHVVININLLDSRTLSPDVFHVTWWQDPAEQLKAAKPLPWRERDLIYSVDEEFDVMLHQCGATNVHRQGFCYDESVFRDIGQEKRSRVVVVASSYRKNIENAPPRMAQLVALLEELFAEGQPLTNEQLERLAKQYDYSRDFIYWDLWFYVVRDQSVRWLCSLSDTLEVEVYGRFWEEDDLVRPFFKGELPHGPAVANVYNAAKYVLVNHPFDLQSQRLMEAAACGAIPIVYDCRYRAERPHWDENFLWYRTQEDMRECLTKIPAKTPSAICAGRSYNDFAKRILAEVSSRLDGR